jgi:hypothetical protein
MQRERQIWKDIPGWEGMYQVSTCGQVKSLRRIAKENNRTRHLTEKLLRINRTVSKRGYVRLDVRFFLDGKILTVTVARLMLLTFVGPPPTGKNCARHLDDDSTHNLLGNLAWGSVQDNAVDRQLNGKGPLGKKLSKDTKIRIAEGVKRAWSIKKKGSSTNGRFDYTL